MTGIIIAIHVIICTLLIIIILIQAGRGGGLVESFSGVESMFGTKTNAFLTRATTILSILFFLTCLTLAVISLKQSKSLMENVKPISQAVIPPTTTPPTAPAEAKTQAPAVAADETKVQAPATDTATKQETAPNAKEETPVTQVNPPSAPQTK